MEPHEGPSSREQIEAPTAITLPPIIDKDLLQAAMSGDWRKMQNMVREQGRDILLGTTPGRHAHTSNNTCLHIASIHGHWEFCEKVLDKYGSLIVAANYYSETPLLVAVTRGHVSLALNFLDFCLRHQQRDAILCQDMWGCNALHHAIRSGRRELAQVLIQVEPRLSSVVNYAYRESPMFIAVMRDYADIAETLLRIPESAHEGTCGSNALHAAVRNGNSDIARMIIEKYPQLSKEENQNGKTPVEQAVFLNKIDVLKVLLKHDWSLGYSISSNGIPLLVSAAQAGHVGVARELLKHCPDAPYNDPEGRTCLHVAVNSGHTEFVEFVMGSQQLRNKLVNLRDGYGETALHYAVKKCNPRITQALLMNHTTADFTMITIDGREASSGLLTNEPPNKISDWNEVSMLLLQKDRNNASYVYYIHKSVKDMVTNASSKTFKSLTQTMISNTFLVAILIATITFAAAFTLPGGYSSEGLPTMARKAAFQAFLISDTIAMCSSLAVAFICIIARWEDIGFLIYYRSFTKKLMWLSYMATTTAFATGLYTVLAPRLLWLAIAVCTLPVLLPIFTKLLDELPFLSLRLRLGRTFKSELLDIVEHLHSVLFFLATNGLSMSSDGYFSSFEFHVREPPCNVNVGCMCELVVVLLIILQS